MSDLNELASRPAAAAVPRTAAHALHAEAAPGPVTEAASGPEPLAGKPKPKPKPKRWRGLVAVSAALLLAAAGAAVILIPKERESTDSAYLRADGTVVAAQVRGRIAEVLVRDNQVVKTGTPLVRIEADEFDVRVALAAAEMQNARAAVASAAAALATLDAEERLAESNIQAVETAVRAATAQQVRATQDQLRFESLVASGAVAARDAESAKAAALVAQAETDRSRAALRVSGNQAALTRTRRAALKASLAQAEAGLARSDANAALARQDQGHTLVRAPVDGVVGALQARVGDYVQPARRLLSLVPLDKLYVLAYFKETQTARMNAGQPAELKVDAMPGVVLTGLVDSFAPGTGSEFAMLPFEPGTGNFTKIVQRVPVRIRLNPDQGAQLAKLRPGLSVTATVRVAN